jgi:hypothetical protein
MPAWAVLCLADSIRRGGDSESFHCEIPKLQQKAYGIQQKAGDRKVPAVSSVPKDFKDFEVPEDLEDLESLNKFLDNYNGNTNPDF